jgi:hypothetical protein
LEGQSVKTSELTKYHQNVSPDAYLIINSAIGSDLINTKRINKERVVLSLC